MNVLSAIQLQHREQFEKNVTWALVGGALGGAAAGVGSGSRLGELFGYCVASMTVFFFAGGDRFDRWLARALSATALSVAFVLPSPFSLAVAGAVGGALLVGNLSAARGHDGKVAQLRPGVIAYLAAAALGAMALVIGPLISTNLSHAVRGMGLHWYPATILAGAATALFFALASAPAHLLLEPDPVEARAHSLLFVLQGDLATLCDRMITGYRRCGELLAQLPRDGARAELAAVTSRTVDDALELAREWQEVEVQLEASSEADLELQLKDLRKDAMNAKDPLAKKQLELAAASLADEVGRLSELSARRERVLARLKATSAELDRTRLSLLALRSARTHLKAAELSALSKKLKSLSAVEATRGELDSAVATGEELKAVEGVVTRVA